MQAEEKPPLIVQMELEIHRLRLIVEDCLGRIEVLEQALEVAKDGKH